MHHLHAVAGQQLLDGSHRGHRRLLGRGVEEQQGVDCDRGANLLFRHGLIWHVEAAHPVGGAGERPKRGVRAPRRAARRRTIRVDHRLAPFTVAPVAQPPEPVLLEHALAKRPGKGGERFFVETHPAEAGEGEGDRCGALRRRLAAGARHRRDILQRLQPGAAPGRRVDRQEQRTAEGKGGIAAHHQTLRLRRDRRRELPAGGRGGGACRYRSRAHASASLSVSVGRRRPLAIRWLRSIWSTVRSG